MKIYLLYLLFSIIALNFNSCDTQNCVELNGDFQNYKQAKNVITKTDFNYSDQIITSKSSWILKADFYSCNNVNGYFLLSTKSKTYIHKGLPMEVWLNFKKASSFGTFYNKNIKDKYQLRLR